jgi:hypothetical protein
MIESKNCTKCGLLKSLNDYYFEKAKSKYRSECKSCTVNNGKKYRENNPEKYKEGYLRYGNENREDIRRREKERRQSDIEKARSKRREYYNNNRERLNGYNRKSYNNNRDINIQKRKQWYQDNKESHAIARERYAEQNKENLQAARRKWENQRLKEDVNYSLQKALRGRIRSAVKGVYKKNKSTEYLIGCTIGEFRKHIEKQFKDGMSWDNWSQFGWHIDHKIPLSWFNLANENCRLMAFNYKNMQPLWWDDNIKKNNKYHEYERHGST